MADVQTEHGSTLIANELIRRVFMRGLLSKAQLQIVFAIIDESWAWIDRRSSTPNNKVKHKTTRRALKPKDISEKTGIHISDVCKQLNILQAAGVIRRHWDYYRFNKNYDGWQLEGLKIDKKATGKKPGKKPKQIGNSPNELGKNPNELGNSPNELGNTPNELGDFPRKIAESQLGKNPSPIREIPYSDEGNSLMRWPAVLRAARIPGPLNKVKESINKVWCLYDGHADYIDKTKELRWEPNELLEIFDYWQMVKFTRSSGKIAPSVIEKEMEYWERFDKEVALFAIAVHKTKYKTKKEDYTRGIMRRSQEEKRRGVSIDEQATSAGINVPGRDNQGAGLPGNTRQVGSQGRRITEERFDELGIGH